MADFRPYGSDVELDKLVDSKDWRVRRNVASQGYGLNRLVDDKSKCVRIAVAK